MGKSTKDQRDHYYRQGKQEGYRARSAYKLLHLDEQYGLLGGSHSLADTTELGGLLHDQLAELQKQDKPVSVIDLCAAPGSWSQVLSRTLPGARIVAVDLQQMAPIPGVVQIVGDITTPQVADAIAKAAAPDVQDTSSGVVDLVICDGAPDVTGIAPLDEYVQSQLLLAAASMASRTLRQGGNFTAKVFVQPGSESARLLVAQLRRQYAHVELAKPRSSRASSAEHFVVCLGFVGAQAHQQYAFLGDLGGYDL
ncbi:tRNA (cytidine(32)/guanosine(34)-2'-O)-methyltransferase [Malassezia cuniculi]|uniref:tRNA (Cytidine(32)/guanosine(34)-2'-O)-methyltransferase n=1 Tax=Malassezia cuniculi TaxID=948313 RepID=A0AAF0F238_9BASI|nr:tRNA (cytidine(32)/guanosine(34)-2'-O)-methyltransferase [Malassezia cuniculi]